MNSFKSCQEIEKRALPDLIPFLMRYCYEGRFVLTDKGALSKEIQKMAGDALLNGSEGTLWTVDWKVEEENKYGNFFLETWSNLRHGFYTVGWMFTLQTDRLLYYFLKEKMLYSIPFLRLKTWAFVDRQIYKYPELLQGKHVQLNKTYGRCVPIEVIRKEVTFKEYDLSDKDSK